MSARALTARQWVVAGVVAVLFAAVGCTSQAPTKPPGVTPTTSLGPVLVVDKVRVDLGTVYQDMQGVQTFLVGNMGGQPLRVDAVSIRVEEGCDVVEVGSKELLVQPGKIALLPVRYGKHQKTGPHRWVVSLSSNDLARPVATVGLSFQVAEAREGAQATSGPRLRVDKDIIDTGTVPNDWPMYERFTLYNEGDAPLLLKETPLVRVEEGC